jgi:2-polyprenyl-6-methoxyphenol hydroxylase-like FAD-dependent oxidoreductase
MRAGPERVLIVGAGPTGLVAGCELRRRGLEVDVLDARSGVTPASKAVLFWPPSVRILQRAGVPAEELDGVRIRSFGYHLPGGRTHVVPFGPGTAPIALEQWKVEAALERALARHGARVRRDTRLVDLRQGDAAVTAVVQGPGGRSEEITGSWLIGADGAHSTIRERLGVAELGSTYPSRFFIVEGGLEGPTDRDVVHYHQAGDGFLLLLPLPAGRFRVGGNLPPGVEGSAETAQRMLTDRAAPELRLNHVQWSGTFTVHRRRAARMQVGRCFLAGDAAHVVSPANGQGVNVGIQDAENLAWKLALVATGTPARLLSTYQPERAAAAALTERQTHLQTRAWLLRNRWAARVRDVTFRSADRGRLLGRWYAPLLAQQRVRYPRAPLGRERAGSPCLPVLSWPRWGTAGRLFPDASALAPVRAETGADGFRLMVAGPAPAELTDRCAQLAAGRPVTVHLTASRTAGGGRLPCRRTGFYVVRPDGYVALHGHRPDVPVLADLLERLFG